MALCKWSWELLPGQRGWGATSKQEDKSKDWYLCCNESRLWNTAEKRCDMGIRKCLGLMKAQNKFYNYVYTVWFLVEPDTDTLVQQLNLPTNNLQLAHDIRWLAWIWPGNLVMNPIQRRLNHGPDGLSHTVQGEWMPPPEAGDNQDETIKAISQSILVEREPQWIRRKRTYEQFDGLRLAEKYKEDVARSGNSWNAWSDQKQRFRRKCSKFCSKPSNS